MSELESLIRKLAAEEAERIVSEMLPEYMRAVGIQDIAADDPELIDAEEVARVLGYNVSSPENIRRSTKRVYTLARQNLIPSVRVSPRCIRFDPLKVREVKEKGGLAEPYSRSA